MVSNKIKTIEESQTIRIATEAQSLKEKGIDIINLNVGEPDFPTPKHIKESAIEAINIDQTKYTINKGSLELRSAIVNKLKIENDLEYDADNVVVSNGAKQCIYNTVHALVSEGDEVLIPDPYWVSYPQMVKLAGGKPVIIPTEEKVGFKVNFRLLKKYTTSKTKLLILCNPSNPTGTTYTKDELKEIADFIKENNLYVISDEIYEKLVYDNLDFTSLASFGNEIKERTVTINGVSKAFSMTGWRIGYSVGSNEVIKGINKIQSHSTSCASSISQIASLTALTGPKDEIYAMRKEFERRRNFLFDSITSIEGISCYKAPGAFYLFPNISYYFGKKDQNYEINNSYDFAMFLLHEAKVATVPGSSFGKEGFLRLSFATSMENLKKAIGKIEDALETLS